LGVLALLLALVLPAPPWWALCLLRGLGFAVSSFFPVPPVAGGAFSPEWVPSSASCFGPVAVLLFPVRFLLLLVLCARGLCSLRALLAFRPVVSAWGGACPVVGFGRVSVAWPWLGAPLGGRRLWSHDFWRFGVSV